MWLYFWLKQLKFYPTTTIAYISSKLSKLKYFYWVKKTFLGLKIIEKRINKIIRLNKGKVSKISCLQRRKW